MEPIDNFSAVLGAGAALSRPQTTEQPGAPFIAVPEGYNVEDLERLLLAPLRKRATVTVTDSLSFIHYIIKHGTEDGSTVYAAIEQEASKFALIAVLNDHGHAPEAAQWRDHRCTFQPALAVEWKRWTAKHKAQFTQADFATWLEDNLPDIASVAGMPTGADILQMALGFEANSDKRLRSKLNLQSGGTQFEFVEDEDKDTRTKMQVFERFTLGLPVFDGSASAYPLEARLKYREKDGKLTFWYELIRPDRVFKAAVADELARIANATAIPVIHGAP